jgi:long-chain acyl-CoA synthetase
MAGGSAMPVEVMRAFEAKFRVAILEGYGLSETSPVASFNVRDRPRNPGSIGYPVWGVEMCILDDNDGPLADGQPGEICIRGHNIMKGYWKRPDATKETLRGGWFHSGDIGIRDADGSYRIVDRKKDMIIVSGFKVFPNEIEAVLTEHPAVLECGCIGVPDPRSGQAVKIFVVTRPGATVSSEELIAHCRERLTGYKVPRYVEFRASLPKTNVGKILRRELAQSEAARAA